MKYGILHRRGAENGEGRIGMQMLFWEFSYSDPLALRPLRFCGKLTSIAS